MALKKNSLAAYVLMGGLLLVVSGCASIRGKNYSCLGSYYFSEKKLDKAVEYYQKALEEDSGNAGYAALLGWSYFLAGNYDAAISAFERLAEIDPKAVDAYTGRGWSNFKKSDYNQAIAYFEEAIAIDPDSADAYGGLGWSNANKGDPETAEKYFNIALAKGLKYKRHDPGLKTDPEAHRGLGYLNFSKGDFKTALKHFKIVTFLKPDWNDARIKWGDCLFSLEKYRAAIAVYRYALNYEKTAPIYDKIGWSHLCIGDKATFSATKNRSYKTAQKMFNKALAIDPNYANSISGLSAIETKISSE